MAHVGADADVLVDRARRTRGATAPPPGTRARRVQGRGAARCTAYRKSVDEHRQRFRRVGDVSEGTGSVAVTWSVLHTSLSYVNTSCFTSRCVVCNTFSMAGITLAQRDLAETRERLEAWFQHRFGDEAAVSELRAANRAAGWSSESLAFTAKSTGRQTNTWCGYLPPAAAYSANTTSAPRP